MTTENNMLGPQTFVPPGLPPVDSQGTRQPEEVEDTTSKRSRRRAAQIDDDVSALAAICQILDERPIDERVRILQFLRIKYDVPG